MTSLNIIDVNTKHARATYIIADGKRMRFGLAIRRVHNHAVNRWCFYVALTEEEYSFLVENQQPLAAANVSFMNMSSLEIGVHKSVSDAVFMEQPTRFIGTHADKDQFHSNWSNAAVEANLAAFYEIVMGALKGVTST